MTSRRAFLSALTGGLLAAPLAAHAQQAGKVWRIGFLVGTTSTPFIEAFRQGLHDLGYTEGQNIVIEYRSADNRYERLPDLAADLVRLKVDVIVAVGTPGPVAAKQATTTIPIVMTNGGDPVGAGLVASLARPGGNVTGLSIVIPDLIGKQLQLLREVLPLVSRVAVLWNPANQMHPLALREAEVSAASLRLQLQFVQARGPEDMAGTFLAMSKERAGALLVLSDAVSMQERKRIADLAAKNRLPTMYPWKEGVEAGGLMAFGANPSDSFRRAAAYVDKILKGAKPGDLPVEQPTRFELVINLKTAKALGLTVPPSLLVQADEVIQ